MCSNKVGVCVSRPTRRGGDSLAKPGGAQVVKLVGTGPDATHQGAIGEHEQSVLEGVGSEEEKQASEGEDGVIGKDLW